MSEEKTATMTIEKGNAEPKVDQKRIDAAKEAFETFGKGMEGKVYLVPGGKTTADAIANFLENKATWAAHESLGIVRAHEDIKSASKGSKKELYLSGLCIEAVAYYVSKATGQGLEEAKVFKDNIFMPINDAMAKINEDKKRAEELQYEWAAAAQGVEVEDLKAQAQG